MLFNDTYKTVTKSSEGIFRDRGSKFIACIFPLSSEAGLKEIVSNVKSIHPKANHHCWALRLSPNRSVFRLNDDGEPSGTAGRPILNTLLSFDLTNVIVIVVRYFGGTLLGVPGLINAYKKATIEAINASVIIELTINSIYEISFDHAQMNDIMKIIKDENLKIRSQQFYDACKLQVEIRQASQELILGRFHKITGVNIKYISTL